MSALLSRISPQEKAHRKRALAHTEATVIPTVDAHYLRLYPCVVDPEQELWGPLRSGAGRGKLALAKKSQSQAFLE